MEVFRQMININNYVHTYHILTFIPYNKQLYCIWRINQNQFTYNIELF